mgnify:CR=1 FL=1
MDNSVEPVVEETDEVKQKMHFTGTVLKTTLAGALVDLGNNNHGVLHISQILGADPAQPVKRVEDVLTVGQSVEVWVRRVKEGRTELTMIKPLDLEWRDLEKGMVVKGKVTRLEKFGAFVEIGAERPGLIDISELAHGYVRTPTEVVNEGDELEAQVLEVNRRKKQIKLSLKALQPEPVKEKEEEVIVPTEYNAQKAKPQRRKKRSRSFDESGDQDYSMYLEEGAQQAEPDPTAMEIAMREAMERAQARKAQSADKKRKAISKEQEDLLSRTLESKMQSS